MYIKNLKQILKNKDKISYLINSEFSKISFSQFGEDLLINKIFKKINYGKFLDLGSFHPIHYSNTFLLYLRGWRGINIDGNKQLIEITNQIRPEDLSLNIYLNHKTGRSFYITNTKSPAMNRLTDNINKLKNEESFIEVQTDTVSNIINNNLSFFDDKFYYLNIDLEFKDLEILKQIDFNLIKPKLITIEAHDRESNDLINIFLQKKGYEFYSYIFPTAFYLQKEFIDNNFQ